MDRDELKIKIRDAIWDLDSQAHKTGHWEDPLTYANVALTAIESAGYVLMPKDMILRKMSHEEFSELMAGIRFRESDLGCQADAGAKGETVSREGALQSGLRAEAFYLDQSAWEGLRSAVRWRLGAAVAKLIRTGTLNRQDIEEMGEVSTPQASADIAEIMKRLPHLMAYDKSRKCYVLAAISQSQIEEAQRADTMPLTSGETPDTNNQDADNG